MPSACPWIGGATWRVTNHPGSSRYGTWTVNAVTMDSPSS
jgi:hypothetical protein